MKPSPLYGISLGLTILVSLAAFVILLGWVGTLVNGAGRLPLLALLPWKTLGLLALAAVNCTLRAELLARKGHSPAGWKA